MINRDKVAMLPPSTTRKIFTLSMSLGRVSGTITTTLIDSHGVQDSTLCSSSSPPSKSTLSSIPESI